MPTSENSSENDSSNDINHNYCLSIDVRNLRSINPSFNWSKSSSSFLIQYSYAFFGPTTKIKTSQINVVNEEIINFENGFFTFNFVTSKSQLRDTFENVALILELIEVSNVSKAVIRGIAHVNLLDLIESEESEGRKLLVIKPIITDYNDDKIAQLTVIFSLQKCGMYQNGNRNIGHGNQIDVHYSDVNSDTDSSPPNVSGTILESATGISNLNQVLNNSMFNQIDHLFIEAALEIESWKQSQVKLFKESMKRKEKKMAEKKIQELALLELKLKESIEKVALKEQLLSEAKLRIESESSKRMAEEISKLSHELEQLKIVIGEKCGKIDKLESQNQQLKNRMLTNGHSDLSRRNSMSSRTSSVSRATGNKLRESMAGSNDRRESMVNSNEHRTESVTGKKKTDPKDFVLRSSAFTRNNSLPSSVRSSSKL